MHFILLSVFIAQAAPVSAVTPQNTPVQRVVPALSTEFVDYLAGDWTGSGTFTRTGKPVESTFRFQPSHDREVLIVEHAEKEPNRFAYSGVISMDSVTGKPVFLMASNNKGGARLFRSEGWQDGRLVFETDPALQAWFARERISFIRKGDRAFKATYEMSRDNGATWRTGDEQDFTKG